MRLVVQRVKYASVSVNGKLISEIAEGLFVLVGIGREDTEKDAEILAHKLSKLRIVSDSSGKMNLSVLDTKSELLVVSQFTLFADVTSGNRPSYLHAMEPTKAKVIYDWFIKSLRTLGIGVKTGKFGEYMNINVSLDGPVTIIY